MNTTEFDYMVEAKDAMNREYVWITDTIRDLWGQAFDANKIYQARIDGLHRLAWALHAELRGPSGAYSTEFYATMETLKGVCGELRMLIHTK